MGGEVIMPRRLLLYFDIVYIWYMKPEFKIQMQQHNGDLLSRFVCASKR